VLRSSRLASNTRPLNLSPSVPTLAGLFLGFGIFTVFIQCLNYIIDAYLMFAASAIAANTIMRSVFGVSNKTLTFSQSTKCVMASTC